MHTDNRKKDILVLLVEPTRTLHSATITAKSKYSINLTASKMKFCLSLN